MTVSSTPGAGPSKPRPSPITVPPQSHLRPESHNVRVRTPTRTSTAEQEVELGVYLGPRCQPTTPSSMISGSLSPSKATFSKCEQLSTNALQKPMSLFSLASEWRTDIVTFCSHVRLGSVLGDARITHIQARKSRRPPFFHEYILVFFTTENKQRFVARIDRLGKLGSASGSILPGCCSRKKRPASNTAVQQVEVHEIQDSQIGIDSPDGPWCARDGGWDSYPVATLVAWSDIGATAQVSHHVQTATAKDGPTPRLSDVSRLLEAILLEMPTYHLTTANCYFMTRTSLLLLQQCFPNSFACFLGSASGRLVGASSLAEPVWAGLLHWYLPFVIFFMVVYFPLVFIIQHLLAEASCATSIACQLGPASPVRVTTWSSVLPALSMACHGLVDVPLPVGILHAWITSLELRMNSLVTRLSAEYQRLNQGAPASASLDRLQPFSAPFQRAWHVLAIWCCAGLLISVWMFLGLLVNRWVMFGFFIFMLLACIAYNLKTPDGDVLEAAEDMFAGMPAELDGSKRERTSSMSQDPVLRLVL